MASLPERLTVHTRHDLVCAVPYLLGFHPTRSLVAVGVTGTSVTLTARCDLPADTRNVTGPVTELADQLHRNRITTAVLISYSGPEPLPALAKAIGTVFPAAGIGVAALLRVTADRYYRHRRADGTCPGDGDPIRPETSLLPAQATVAGLAPMPDRATIAAQLDPVDPAQCAGMAEATRRALDQLATQIGHPDTATSDPETNPVRLARRLLSTRSATHSADLTHSWRALLVAALDTYRAGEILNDDDAATLTFLLVHPLFRDHALGVTHGSAHHQALWTDLTRRAVPALSPRPQHWSPTPRGAPATAHSPYPRSNALWPTTPTCRSHFWSPRPSAWECRPPSSRAEHPRTRRRDGSRSPQSHQRPRPARVGGAS